MTEELKEQIHERVYNIKVPTLGFSRRDLFNIAMEYAEPREKRIEELEEKISVLLSCKNCPENKGGLLCQKEYENKCLAQKIQFIKELQEENAELKADYEVLSCSVGDFGELQDKLEEEQRKNNGLSDNLTKAKELLKDFVTLDKDCDWNLQLAYDAEQFLSEVEK